MGESKINMNSYTVRKASILDKNQIFSLYKIVSKTLGGLARNSHEITTAYIDNFCSKSQASGIQLIIEDKGNIVAEIHCYKLEPSVFHHVLSELTIAVDPNYQGKGLGKLIFQSLLNIIEEERADILRLELIARESNQKAIQFYQKLGFVIEGRFEKRISASSNSFEADIPMAWFNPNFNNSINPQ